MFRFMVAFCLMLATAESGFGQDYAEKNEDQATRMGVITFVTGQVTIKKSGDEYDVALSLDVHRDGRNETASGVMALILLNDKCEPTFCVSNLSMTASCAGDSVGASGTGSSSIKLNAKTFQAASGYLMIVKSEKASFDTSDLKAFVKSHPTPFRRHN